MKPVHVTERDYGFDPTRACAQVVKNKQSVFADADGVRLLSSSYKTGINRRSGKRWWRWQQVSVRGIRRNSTGLLIPFGYTCGPGRARHYSAALALLPLEPMAPRPAYNSSAEWAYLDELATRLNVRALHDIYPMTRHFGVDRFGHIPSGLHMAMRQTSGPEFARLAFGKSQYRRDLVRAACSAEPWAIAVAREFRGLVPADWIVAGLKGSADNGRPTIRTRGLRPALRSLDPRSLRHLVGDLRRDVPDLAGDILRMNQGQPLQVRSWAQWHDELAGGWSKRRQVDTEIPQVKLAKRLHGLKIGDMEIRTAQSTGEMSAWGDIMHNCIGSYGRAAVHGSGVYAAVYRNGGMVANLEVGASGQLKQLLGRFNQRLSDDDRKALEAGLASQGVNVVADYWGSAA